MRQGSGWLPTSPNGWNHHRYCDRQQELRTVGFALFRISHVTYWNQNETLRLRSLWGDHSQVYALLLKAISCRKPLMECAVTTFLWPIVGQYRFHRLFTWASKTFRFPFECNPRVWVNIQICEATLHTNGRYTFKKWETFRATLAQFFPHVRGKVCLRKMIVFKHIAARIRFHGHRLPQTVLTVQILVASLVA